MNDSSALRARARLPRRGRSGTLVWAFAFVWFAGCEEPLNNPYPKSQTNAPIYYTSYSEPPKHLDPARSYSSDEYQFIMQIYEPPFDYHFLKRPYEITPLTASALPELVYRDAEGNILDGDPKSADVHRAQYTIRIRQGIEYQPHPCFAKAGDGSPYYADVTAAQMSRVDDLKNLRQTGTRQLLAKDYVTQICRLADPRLNCPIYSTMKKYIVGLEAYREALSQRIDQIRAKRRDQAGFGYDKVRDERLHPIAVDYLSIPLEGVRVVDDHTYTISLERKYPQMLYWLAMPFFAPMPQEAIDFYAQGPMLERDITLDRYPVGTGPYRFETYDRNLELALVRNENFRREEYPSEGETDDAEDGLLDDAGKTIPFIERIVYKLEKESLPKWNKFLQGYYDQSGISEESFDRVIEFGPGGVELSNEMKDKKIRLRKSVNVTIFYIGFNMLDDIVGGYTPQKQKLRQAISIAINSEEWIEIFSNGRGIPPHGPIPPGIPGNRDLANGYNRFIYEYNEDLRRPVRKSIEEARLLLAEAGYPGGRDATGQPLTIHFDNAWERPGDQTRLLWLKKAVDRLGVRLQLRTTDYSTFRDKVDHANFQLLFWGWNADYPDPENFLFLFYGPNGKKESRGENGCNYSNAEFNQLFVQMESMSNGPERIRIIDRMVDLIQQDSPWIFMSHPVSYALSHEWVTNLKPNLMSYNTMKFKRLNAGLRTRRRTEWNSPVFLPVILIVVCVVVASIPAVRIVRRNR